MITEHKHIIFCSDGINGLGLVRSLGEYGINPIVILQDCSEQLVSSSRYAKCVHIVKYDDEAVKLLIDKYGNETNKPFVYVGDDWNNRLLDQNYDKLIDHFYFFNAGGKGEITKLQNKNLQLEMAASCGIPIPLKEVVEKGEMPKVVKFPLITKTLTSVMGKWKGDCYICNNAEELEDAYKVIEAPQLVLEEYIEKKNELEINGFSINGGEDVFFTYSKLYYRYGDKSFGHYMYYEPCVENELTKSIRNLLKIAHFSGLFDVEFLVGQNDELYFLEVNWRSWMSNYAHTVVGINLPVLWAESTLNGHIDYANIKIDREHFTSINEIGDYMQSVKSKKISFKQYFKDLKSADTYYYYNKKDIKPLFVALWHIFKRKIRKI